MRPLRSPVARVFVRDSDAPAERAMSRTPAPWWRSYFDDVFFELHDPLFPEADSRREVAAMLDMLGLPAGARVLDVPCGWGRHTDLLAEAGFDAVGADFSLALLARAGARGTVAAVGDHLGRAAGEPETDARTVAMTRAAYVAADIRALPFADASFDGAIDVFTSVGLFAKKADDLRALREIRRVLRPGAHFLLETMHRDDVVANYAEGDAWSLPDGTEIRVRRRFDAVRGLSREILRWRRRGESGEKRHTLRLRTATDVIGLLRRAGFEVVETWGDWDGQAFRHDSPRLICSAE